MGKNHEHSKNAGNHFNHINRNGSGDLFNGGGAVFRGIWRMDGNPEAYDKKYSRGSRFGYGNGYRSPSDSESEDLQSGNEGTRREKQVQRKGRMRSGL